MAAAPAGLEISFANIPGGFETVTVRTTLVSRRFIINERQSTTEIDHVTDRAIAEVQGAVRAMVAEWDELS